MAQMAGVPVGYLLRVERGEEVCSRDRLLRFAGVLGVAAPELVGRTGNALETPLAPGVPSDYPPSTFFLQLVDDSMAPAYPEATIAVLTPLVPHEEGDCVAAVDDLGQIFLRRYDVLGDGEEGEELFQLTPCNPAYPLLRSDRIALSILGTMTQHWTRRAR